jgi:copper homeostasis protein
MRHISENMMKVEIEICIEQLHTAQIAGEFKVNRVELCSALDLGGLTPSFGMTQACSDIENIQVFSMIRPRGGDFVYDEREINIMAQDIRAAKKAGADGVVFGCLLPDNRIDLKNTRFLFEIAHSLNLGTTFHRAFDFVPSPQESLTHLISIGFDRILTSGTKATAIEGEEIIRNLVNISKGRIDIMAGSGVNPHNVTQIVDTGVQAIHFTARRAIKYHDTLNMGLKYTSDSDKIKNILHEIA